MKKLLSITLFFLFTNCLNAQWPSLSTPNVQVTSSVSTSGNLKDYWACTDGNGGSFSFFTDDRQDVGGNESIYCQRIDKNGNVKFTTNGVSIGTISTADQDTPNCTEDGFNNAIVCWEDDRSGNDDIYAQKIDSSGNVQWATNGIVICNATGDQKDVWIVPDDSGGAILAWEDERGANIDIYAQRINATGTPQWTANGVVICNATGDQDRLHIVEDGNGGAIITWEDQRGANTDIYAQRINATGTPQWTANGVVICSADDDQDRPQITTDGFNGGIISWTDQRSGTEDIYAQRIDSIGVVIWSANGIVISTATDVQDRSKITSDQSNGAVIVWEDERSGADVDIYAQRINSSGATQWTANGLAVCTATDDQAEPNLTVGNFGATLIVWEDARTAGIEDIYTQILTASGANLVATNGLAVSTATGAQKQPFIFRNDVTDWIVIWEDDRNSGTGKTDLFAQGINPFIITALPIELLSFEAIKEGDKVMLYWQTASEINNDYFTIERSLDALNWEGFVLVGGAGNSSSLLSYESIDKSPFFGISYYRLKQTDFDGKYSYSKVISVKLDKFGSSQVYIYPNPTDNHITIEGDKLELEQIKIYNLYGQDVSILTRRIKANKTIIDLSKLSNGMYYIKTKTTANKVYKQ